MPHSLQVLAVNKPRHFSHKFASYLYTFTTEMNALRSVAGRSVTWRSHFPRGNQPNRTYINGAVSSGLICGDFRLVNLGRPPAPHIQNVMVVCGLRGRGVRLAMARVAWMMVKSCSDIREGRREVRVWGLKYLCTYLIGV